VCCVFNCEDCGWSELQRDDKKSLLLIFRHLQQELLLAGFISTVLSVAEGTLVEICVNDSNAVHHQLTDAYDDAPSRRLLGA
jgi:hypothetical protein